MKETRSPIRSPRILSEILNEVRPPPLLSASSEAELEAARLRGDPEDKLTSFSENIEKIEDVITSKSSDSEESKNRNSRRDSPPPLELAPLAKNTLPYIVIQSSEYSENIIDEMWESRSAQVS